VTIYIRQSEIKQWKQCRRRTDLQYGQNLVPKRPDTYIPSKADLGSVVHLALEYYYREGASPANIVRLVRAEQARKFPEQADAWADTYALAEIMVSGYLEWLAEEGEDAGFTVTDVERRVEVPFGNYHGEEVVVVGHVDLEGVDSFGRPVLIDHKTVQAIEDRSNGPVDDQRLTYAVLRMLEDGTQYGALIHNQLRRVKRTARSNPPFYARTEVQFNIDHLRKHHGHMRQIVNEIVLARQMDNEARDMYLFPNPTKDCHWSCPFYHVCPMIDDGSDWQWYLGEMFDVDEGANTPGLESV
jgi:hypothetical protein